MYSATLDILIKILEGLSTSEPKNISIKCYHHDKQHYLQLGLSLSHTLLLQVYLALIFLMSLSCSLLLSLSLPLTICLCPSFSLTALYVSICLVSLSSSFFLSPLSISKFVSSSLSIPSLYIVLPLYISQIIYLFSSLFLSLYDYMSILSSPSIYDYISHFLILYLPLSL